MPTPKHPAPDRYLAIAGLITAIVAAAVGLGWIPGRSYLAELSADELADLIAQCAVAVGVLATAGATWRGRLEARR